MLLSRVSALQNQILRLPDGVHKNYFGNYLNLGEASRLNLTSAINAKSEANLQQPQFMISNRQLSPSFGE